MIAAQYTGQEGSLNGLDGFDWEYWGKVLTTVTLVASGLGAVWRVIVNGVKKLGAAVKDTADGYVRSVTAPQVAATQMLADGFRELNGSVQHLAEKVEDLGGRASAIEDTQDEILNAHARTEERIKGLEANVADIRARMLQHESALLREHAQ